MFFKLYKWHQIAQNLTYEGNNPHRVSFFSLVHFLSIKCWLFLPENTYIFFFPFDFSHFWCPLSFVGCMIGCYLTLLCKMEPVWYFKGSSYRNSRETSVICQLYHFLYENFSTEWEEKHQPQQCGMTLDARLHYTNTWHMTLIYRDTKRFLGNLWPWKFKTFHEKCLWWSG